MKVSMWNYQNIRSGSSFIGSLMSAGEEVTYIYEPSLEMHINGTVGEYLIDLFQCEISYNKRQLLHKNIDTCKISNARIIKTIREGVRGSFCNEKFVNLIMVKLYEQLYTFLLHLFQVSDIIIWNHG